MITADTDDIESSGTASLFGDFGLLIVGEIDADGAFQSGDVAGAVPDTPKNTVSKASIIYGVHFSGSAAGLSIAAQVNANKGASKYAKATDTRKTKSTQMSATYEVRGLSIGYAYASADATNTNNNNGHNGVHKG